MMTAEGKTVYIWDKQLARQCNKIPTVKTRDYIELATEALTLTQASMVHSLVKAYKLLPQLQVTPSVPASHKQLCKFHNKQYVDFLRSANNDLDKSNEDQEWEKQKDDFGLGYDCPVLYRMYNFARVIGGASIQAAQALVLGHCKTAINWCGGWHHAHKKEAQGFCYVNDIALAILKLLEKFPRVLYVDLDVHHGNGVEAAFAEDCRVLTWSLHLHEPGFFPCTGALSDVGLGSAKYYTVNVPFRAGLSDDNLRLLFSTLSGLIYDSFRPDAVVVQCGADGLTQDPLGQLALTEQGIGQCVKTLLDWGLPTLFLGGGGYNFANTARLWAYLTSIIVNQEISSEIPEHKYFLDYGTSYELSITPGLRPDLNTVEYLDFIISTIRDNLKNIKES